MPVDCEREVMPESVFMPEVADASLTTPAGFEAIATLVRRRWIAATLNVVTWGLLLVWAGSILATGGWTWLDVAVLVCLAFGTPWPVLGFWNAAIGFWQLHGAREATAFLGSAEMTDRVTVKTAVLMTLRNEEPARALLRLKTVKASLDKTGEGENFSYFVLSDTDIADVARREEEGVAAWRMEDGDHARIFYRRRQDNAGFKAGNVRDFATRWGSDFTLMLPLDADSLMTGTAIIELVRVMQKHPKLGILQSIVVGTPSGSAFTRIFQFGMRLGMRTYTMGQAWWVGDCGPFWGHNALVRIKPFVEHCTLPVLAGKPPFGGEVLSHDQVEAALMRRAGFEVRVLPVEIGSYEDNPPNVLEFMQRDTRWCQGNLQYLKLVGLPGLLPVSRYQLIWAVLMFVGVPAWTVLFALTPFVAADAQRFGNFPFGSALVLYLTLLLMYLAPKLAGVLNALLTPGEVRRFGGRARFGLSAVIEIVFSFLLAAITSLRTSLFMAGLLLGKTGGWQVQHRDVGGISWRVAASALWPQFVFGIAVCGAVAAVSPAILLWSLPLTIGYVLAVPFAVLTASPAVGGFLRQTGIAGIPEDFVTPPEIRAVQQHGGGL
jgi:membrane glycosyltransferase